MNSRNDEVRRALLGWIAREQKRQPNPEEFVGSSDAIVNGTPATLDETLAAARNLAAHSLVIGLPVNEFDYPIRPQLTDTGQIAVDDYDCDVAQWVRSQGGSYSDQSVHVSNAGHVAVHSTSVTQSGDVTDNVLDVEALVSAAHAVQSLLTQLGITEDQTIQARKAIADILSGAQDDVVDNGLLKAAGGRLVSILNQAGTAVAGAALAAGLIQALHLAGI
jgi:hypothetical protein